MPTNFERWKEGLNEKDKTFFEGLAKKSQDVYVALTAYCLCDCLWCPLFPVHCSGVPRNERNKDTSFVCLRKLTEWANAPAKETDE